MPLTLKKHPKFNQPKGPVIQIILDGFGYGDQDFEYNACTAKYMPTFFKYFDPGKPNCAVIGASERYAGVDHDVVGNSEVGHNAIGSGQYKDQGGRQVNKAVTSGELVNSPVWVDHIVAPILAHPERTLHVMGLVQAKTIIHADIKHLYALVDNAVARGVKSLALHGLTDGRDDPDRYAIVLFGGIQKKFADINARHPGFNYRIGSGGGRMRITMDRYEDSWKMVEKGWHAHVLGLVSEAEGGMYVKHATDAIQHYYDNPDPKFAEIDQYMYPFVVIDGQGKATATIQDGDSVVFFNFRGDRAIEISRAFEDPKFNYFDRVRVPKIQYAGMMLYDGDNAIPNKYLITAPGFSNTTAELLAASGLPMFAISETAKFGHVTYFADGNRGNVKDAYTHLQVRGDPAEMYVTHPEMKATEITHKVLEWVRSGKFCFGRVNFANPDMIGHTGNWESVCKCVCTLSDQLALIFEAIAKAGGIAVVFSDHGNADEMVRRNKKGQIELRNGKPVPHMSHTLAKVPVLVYDPTGQQSFKFDTDPKRVVPSSHQGDVPGAGLFNMAATCLNLMGYGAPEFYWPSLVTPTIIGVQ